MNPVQSDNLRNKLKLRHFAASQSLGENHPHVKTFLDNAGLNLAKVRHHSARLLAAGTIGGALLLSPSKIYAQDLYLPEPITQHMISSDSASPVLTSDWLESQLTKVLPPITNAFKQPFLTSQEEKVLGKIVERGTGVKAVPTLEGEHLNTVYGYIGAEQHLRRFPSDNITQHGKLASVEGMAPGNGGFGYFTEDGKLTQTAIDREKYYVAVQLMYLPDWEKRLKYLVNWYKFRKVIVVNPDNGKAVVAVIGDAGPAAWTGKHFGGSPEVMDTLGGSKYKKGRVLLYFVDDPLNTVPLGPVDNSGQVKPPTLDEFLKGIRQDT